MEKAGSNAKVAAGWQYSLEDLFDDYTECLQAANRSNKTISGYLDSLRGFSEFLRENNLSGPVAEIGTAELTHYVMHLRNRIRRPNKRAPLEQDNAKLSPHTIRGYVRDIKVFWNWLAKQGYVAANRLAGFPMPKVPKLMMPTLSAKQIGGLLVALDRSTPLGLRNYTIITLFYDTAIRLSELTGLKLTDIDMQYKLIKVHGKGDKERYVPITAGTRKLLTRYLGNARPELCSVESPYLFPRPDGERISGSAVQQLLRRLAKKCGLNGVKCSPHVFRHSSATASVVNGANVETLRAIMGHESILTTAKYTHLLPSDLQRQHAKFSPMNSFFGENAD